jgi:hypothetical protein
MLVATLLATVAVAQTGSQGLVGTWNSKVQFTNGAFKTVKDLEFLMVFNQGGTMVESSNYDAAPPVPPAYGIWRRTGTHRYEAKYIFYVTKAPKKFEEVSGGGGWMPDGRGVLLEKIDMASNGKTYRSRLTMKLYGANGKLAETWQANCKATRVGW